MKGEREDKIKYLREELGRAGEKIDKTQTYQNECQAVCFIGGYGTRERQSKGSPEAWFSIVPEKQFNELLTVCQVTGVISQWGGKP